MQHRVGPVRQEVLGAAADAGAVAQGGPVVRVRRCRRQRGVHQGGITVAAELGGPLIVILGGEVVSCCLPFLLGCSFSYQLVLVQPVEAWVEARGSGGGGGSSVRVPVGGGRRGGSWHITDEGMLQVLSELVGERRELIEREWSE